MQIARDESRALELQPTRLERYLQFASINQYSIAAAVALWVGIFGIVALIFARRRSAALLSLSILCLLVCAAAAGRFTRSTKEAKDALSPSSLAMRSVRASQQRIAQTAF